MNFEGAIGIGLSGVWLNGSGRKTGGAGSGGWGNLGRSCPRLSSAETTSAGPSSRFILFAAGGAVAVAVAAGAVAVAWSSWSAWSFKNFFQWRTGGCCCCCCCYCCSSLLFFFLDTTSESGWSLEDDSTEETDEVGETCKVSSESARDDEKFGSEMGRDGKHKCLDIHTTSIMLCRRCRAQQWFIHPSPPLPSSGGGVKNLCIVALPVSPPPSLPLTQGRVGIQT